ncbi:MAG TPA: serine/threonine-protein kinase [Gemmataceae bacterium]|nr:serine/threonine-protein kinase [Gemmataceae bacterium]
MARSSRSRRHSHQQSNQSLLDKHGSGCVITPDSVPFPGYRLLDYLGRGGYGEVWSAKDPEGKKLAIKFLYCEDHKGGRELRTLQKIGLLQHPNLIHHHRVWCYQNYLCVAMELAEGGLDDLLDQALRKEGKPLDKEMVCDYLGQAAEALDFLNTPQHQIDRQTVAVYHCDVKPSNILMVGGQVKLTDFGLSLITQSTLHQHSPLGTTNFAAPEVFQGRYNNRTDQYALAVSYCVLRGGQLPFPDSPRKFERDYVRPAPDLSMLPEVERPAVARALAPPPNSRWPSCSELIAQLRRAGAPREEPTPSVTSSAETELAAPLSHPGDTIT